MNDDFAIDNESFGPSEKVPTDIPELRTGTQVYVNNKEHKLYLEQGIITEKTHKYYRLKMVSTNKDINNTFIWFPDHWIDPIPKELKSKQ
jgi:hypothetical protein